MYLYPPEASTTASKATKYMTGRPDQSSGALCKAMQLHAGRLECWRSFHTSTMLVENLPCSYLGGAKAGKGHHSACIISYADR